MASEYEKQRDINIQKNQDLLLALGLEKPFFEPREPERKKQTEKKERKKEENRKRKLDADAEYDDEEEEEEQPRKALKEDNIEDAGPRRSSRNRGKKIDYQREKKISSPLPRFVDTKETENSTGGGKMNRTQNPKTYGSIPGIEVGTWWASRESCSEDAIHAPWVGGIAVGPHGAYSVALSGGYADDVDVGYAFTYTGSGGRDLKGTKAAPKNLRTGPQSSDQTFDNNFNRALKRSCESRKPVRVVRGFKLKSKYGPSGGYRYDGLYYVEKAWIEPGLNAGRFKVCKFAFKRLPNQPPLPVRDLEEGDEGGSADGEAEDDPDMQSEPISEAVEDEDS